MLKFEFRVVSITLLLYMYKNVNIFLSYKNAKNELILFFQKTKNKSYYLN